MTRTILASTENGGILDHGTEVFQVVPQFFLAVVLVARV